ncbi:MAG: hypothetical protein ACPH74_08670, partial [Candidatus Puniceispirillum sp.]
LYSLVKPSLKQVKGISSCDNFHLNALLNKVLQPFHRLMGYIMPQYVYNNGCDGLPPVETQ